MNHKFSIVRHFDRLKAALFALSLSLLPIVSTASSDTPDLVNASIADLQTALNQGDINSVDLVKHYLARIAAYDQQHTALNAIIRLNPKALEQAAELDSERKTQGARGPLHGIPIVVKDNFNTSDLATTAGSVAFAGFIPPADAVQVAKLRQAGAIILAKTNMDELAAGAFGISAVGGQTKNPYDLSRNPGGSSAGTAVAVAARFAAAGMGTDTCGSITIPSSFNYLVGLRPSKGLTSIAGIIPLYTFTDVGGPIARSVQDVATIMDAVVGYEPKNPIKTERQNSPSSGFVKHLKSADLAGLRLGRLKNYFDDNPLSQVNSVIAQAIETLQQQGVTVIDIDTTLFDTILPNISWGPPSSYNADMSHYLQSYPGSGFTSAPEFVDLGLYREHFDHFTPPIRESIYLKGMTEEESRLRAGWLELLNQAIEQIMAVHSLNALVFPSVSTIPAKLDEDLIGNNCKIGAYSGTPVLALPVGFTKFGLPIGVNLLSTRLNDHKLLAMGYAIEQAIKPTIKKPSLPLTTPRLVNGQPPKPIAFRVAVSNIADVDLIYQPTQSTLHYQTHVKAKQKITTLCLHKARKGAVIRCLYGMQGRRSNGKIALNLRHVRALKNNELYLRVYSHASPSGQLAQQVIFPKESL